MAEAALRLDRPLSGIAYVVAGVTVFSVQDVIIKWLSGDYPVLEIVFVRSLVALLLLFAMAGLRGRQRLRVAKPFQQPGHAPLCFPSAHHVVHQQRLHDGETDRQARIERGVGILKDELNIAPQVLQRRPLQLIDSPPGEGDGAALAVHQLQQRAPGGGLAAAGLAHQSQRLAGKDLKRHAIDCTHHVRRAFDREVLDQTTNADERLALL